MTGPPAVDDPLLQAARWCARLAAVLADVARRASQLGDAVARDWPDATGRGWAERAELLGSALGREAAAAEQLSGAYTREAAVPPVAGAAVPPVAGVLPPPPGPGRRTGMQLGGSDARRVTDERGMRIAELGPPPPG